MRNWLGIIVIVLAGIALAVLGTTPPAPKPANAPDTAFSASRAMTDVRRIASAPHPTGSLQNQQVRAYLVERLRALGLEVRTVEAPLAQAPAERMKRWSKGQLAPTKLVNVIGVLPGQDPTLPAVALMAHHDSVWGSPGAADDTAGVATILETLRAIKASGPQQRDLVVIITDAEELGLNGARHFFAEDPLRQHIGAVINMEARGGGGMTTLFQTSRQNGEAVRRFVQAASDPAGSSLAAYIYSVLPNDTDLTETLKGNAVGYNFAFIGRPGLYHSPLITPERLDQGSLQGMGSQVLDLSRNLLRGEPLPPPSPNVVFFDLFGLIMITYPVWIGWLMIAGITASLGLVLRRDSNAKALAGGMVRMFALMLGAGLLLTVLNKVSGAGAGSNYYDRLAAIPLLEVMAMFTCASAFVLVLGGGLAGAARKAGAVLLLALISLAAQIVAPAAAYFIVLPTLLSALAIAATTASSSAAAKAFASISAALVLGYMLALGHQIMQGVGPTMPFVVALPLAIAALALVLVWPGMKSGKTRPAALALLGLGLATALWIRLDPMADTVAVYSLNNELPPVTANKVH